MDHVLGVEGEAVHACVAGLFAPPEEEDEEEGDNDEECEGAEDGADDDTGFVGGLGGVSAGR